MDVALPNGTILRGVPDGTPKEQIMAKAISAGLAKPTDFATISHGVESFDPSEGMTGVDKFRAGMGKGFVDIGRGLGQLFGLVDDEDVAASRQRDARLMESPAAVGGNITGQIASLLAGGSALRGLGRAGELLGLARTGRGVGAVGTSLFNPTSLRQAAGGGAVAGALQPTVGDESRLTGGAMGAVGGAGGYGLASLAGRALHPVRAPLSPEDARLAQQLERQGVDLDALDLTESKPLKVLESVFENIPFTAGRAGARAERRAEQFTRAALRTMGSDATRITPDVLDEASTRLGSQFDALVQNNPIDVDGQFFDDLTALVRSNVDNLPPSLAPGGARQILGDLDVMRGPFRAGQQPQITPEVYQQITSALAKRARGARMSDPQLASFYDNLRDAVDDLAERNLGGDTLSAWRDLRRQYRNFKIIERAADNTQSALQTGHIRPQDLRAAVRTVGKEKPSRARSELAELSRAGSRFANLTPDSGTAQRAAMQNLLLNPLSLGAIGGGAGYYSGADPATTAGMLGMGIATPMLLQRAMYSPHMRNYFTTGIVPPGLEQLGQAVRVGSTRAGSALLGGQE